MTIIGKKFPMIHSKTMAKIRRTGPTKKKMPLEGVLVFVVVLSECETRVWYVG